MDSFVVAAAVVAVGNAVLIFLITYAVIRAGLLPGVQWPQRGRRQGAPAERAVRRSASIEEPRREKAKAP